jgi:hypothetical protein
MKARSSSAPVSVLTKRFASPAKIQDYIGTLRERRIRDNPIIRCPRRIVATGTASCIEGALVAAVLLKKAGYTPYLLDLKVSPHNDNDLDHVVTLFKKDGYWGAVSKTYHAVLRYREPIYKSVRELAMSYFHEYFTSDGKKNLRSFSKPFSLGRYGSSWIDTDEDLYFIALDLDASPHTQILTKTMEQNLRLADPIERTAGVLKER